MFFYNRLQNTLNSSLVASKPRLLVELVGGSHLYGLNTKDSDVDYRGIFLATDPKYLSGLKQIESYVVDGEVDATYYELTRYLCLLRKSNTQVLEILFAPDSAFTYKHPAFEELQDNRYNLIDSNTLKSSLKGYVFSEMRLATGERTGQLGGKRKQSLDEFGFSPKNFTQILRLCEVGIKFFDTGEYMVNVKNDNPQLHSLLIEIKTNPAKFSKEQLTAMVHASYEKLCEKMDASTVNFQFNEEIAAQIILNSRKNYDQ